MAVILTKWLLRVLLTHKVAIVVLINQETPFQQNAIDPFSLGLTILVFIFKKADKLQKLEWKAAKIVFCFLRKLLDTFQKCKTSFWVRKLAGIKESTYRHSGITNKGRHSLLL